ncbi:MAG: zinc ribbon domain-containing protein [Methanobrevibacter sp.]|nr:zinc ribbon domain-containing protein [Methanobrevibacter sp.]
MAKCPSCGASVNAADKRCSKCGAKLDNQKSNTPSSKLIIGIVIIVIILVIVGAFSSGVFTSHDAQADTAKDDESSQSAKEVNNDNSNSDETADTEYWASVKAEKFHLPDCEWAQKISEDNKVIYDSREDALSDGKIPCGECDP